MEATRSEPDLGARFQRKTRAIQTILLGLILLGFAVRIGLLCISVGSVDASYFWPRLASEIARNGLYDTYRSDPWMNHPPLSGLFAALVYRASLATDLSFPFLFKIPQVLADAVLCGLLYDIYRHRQTGRAQLQGLFAAALFAWNLDAILLSAFHCNTDPSYSMLCVAALWLADSKRRPMLAGLVLGAAINIKLLPGLFVLPILLLCRSWREFLRMFVGLGIMSLPFLWMLFDLGHDFRMRVLSYSPRGYSGLGDILLALEQHPLLKHYVSNVFDRYVAATKPLILMATVLPILAMRHRGDWSRYRAFALASAVLVVVTPGFAIQYTAMVGAVLFAYDVQAGVIWGVLTGLQLLSYYFFLWDGRFPITTGDLQGGPGPAKYFEMLAWGWMICFLVREMRSARGLRDGHRESVPS